MQKLENKEVLTVFTNKFFINFFSNTENECKLSHFYFDWELYLKIHGDDPIIDINKKALQMWEQDIILPFPSVSADEMEKVRWLIKCTDTPEIINIRAFEHIFHPDNVKVCVGSLDEYVALRNQFSKDDLIYSTYLI